MIRKRNRRLSSELSAMLIMPYNQTDVDSNYGDRPRIAYKVVVTGQIFAMSATCQVYYY